MESYFPGFANARIFEPNLPPEILDSRPVPKMERLPTIYNADVGQCVISNNVRYSSACTNMNEGPCTLFFTCVLFFLYDMIIDSVMQWKVNASEIGVLHYTIGPLKPWDWWTSWLLKPVDAWQV